MKLRAQRATALTAAVVGCSAAVFGAAGAASAASSTQGNMVLNTVLPFSDVADMVVDTHTGHIFVSGGSGTSYVEVLNLSGGVVGRIPNQQGASGMVLSADGGTLYVADSDSDSVSAVDASTLDLATTYPTTGLSPGSIALAGGELWFTTSSTLDVKELDLTTGAVTSTGANTFYYGAALESSPAAPNTLVTGTYGMSPAKVYVYTVVSGALTLTTGDSGQLNSSMQCDNLGGMAITPDGESLVVSCGSPYYAIEVSLAGLDDEGTYETGPYPNSAAVSSDGKVLVGVESGLNDGPLPVAEFEPGDATAIGDYGVYAAPYNGAESVPDVAWGANDSVFYAVVNAYGSSQTLESVFLNPSLTLTAPLAARPGGSYTVAGSLTAGGAAVPGTEVTVTRTENGTSVTMGTYPTDASGAFSFTDTSAPIGTTATYTASVVGDSSFTASASLATVAAVSPITPVSPKPRPAGVVKAAAKVVATQPKR